MAKLHVTREYATVPNKLLANPGISVAAKALWGYLQSKPDNWEFSHKRIADDFKEGEKVIMKALRELIETQWLTRQKRRTGKMDYYLHEPPYAPLNSQDTTDSAWLPNRPPAKSAAIYKKEVKKERDIYTSDENIAETAQWEPNNSIKQSVADEAETDTDQSSPLTEPFDAGLYLRETMAKDKQRHIRLISFYVLRKNETFGTPLPRSYPQVQELIRRYVKTAVRIADTYNDQEIHNALHEAFEFTKDKTTLETIYKYLCR